MRREAGRHGLAGLAVLGVVVIAGVVAGWGISPVEPSEISPADVVALRFPADWDEATGSVPAAPAAAHALASAQSQSIDADDILFSPHRTLALPASAAAWAPTTLAADRANSLAPEPRTQSRSEADPAKPSTVTATKPEAQPETRIAAARPVVPPERRPAPQARKDSGVMFNDAQLASIKSRLKLSAYQEQYWPPVASALRDIGWRAAHDGAHNGNARGARAHLAQIDPDGPEVQRLKSAAFPLIMSMNGEQKQEVRMLAQAMGLEQVAASF